MNRYIYDQKLKESYIESDEMKCSHCEQLLKEKENVYMGIRSKRIRCKKCVMKEGNVESDIMLGDIEWRPGEIRKIKGV